ncbi:MAG TPA: hypothetical protein VFN75_04855 [Pseudonocardiaceae bacterium]|nr:hypothetical protein [Pseudonocardiaceae bacterium]
MSRRRWALIALVTAVLAGLLTVGTWASLTALSRPVGVAAGPGTAGGWYGPGMGPGMMGGAYGPGMMGSPYGPGMMGGAYGLPGDGRPVQTLAAAHQRAQLFADRLGLRAGEVMQFSNGFYAELLTDDGHGATEVLIDPVSGAVGVEYGPAMMWNTRYGMHGAAAPAPAQVSAADATRLAQQWLDNQHTGLTAGESETFPGYYTLHTLRSGKIDGMLSVNAFTGAVWYHSWHGTYLAMTQA